MSTAVPSTIVVNHPALGGAQSERCWLVQLHPLNLEQNRVEIGQRSLVIGRAPECDLQLEDDSVSRRHAEIRPTPVGCEIIDLGSTNGVQVNDQPQRQTLLRSGDRLRLGQRIFRFLANDDVENQYHETVYTMMTRDGLTSVFNKRYLIECLQREVVRASRHHRPLAVILLDIDHFKSINDTYGHLVGDEVLREVARRLLQTLRGDEVLARFGGEEFAIVAAECGPEEAVVIAERCRLAVSQHPFATAAGQINVTISLGVSSPLATELSNSDELVSEADARLYEAKRNGRNRVHV